MRRSLTARPLSLETLLEREQDAMDRLLAGVRNVRSPEHFDELEEEAVAIGARIRAGFRTCRRA